MMLRRRRSTNSNSTTICHSNCIRAPISSNNYIHPTTRMKSMVIFLWTIALAVCCNANNNLATWRDQYYYYSVSRPLIIARTWGYNHHFAKGRHYSNPQQQSSSSLLSSNQYHPQLHSLQRITHILPRGGALQDEENEDVNVEKQTANSDSDEDEDEQEVDGETDEQADDEAEDEQADEEEEEGEEEEEEDEEAQTEVLENSNENLNVDQSLIEYDEPFVASSWTNLYVSFGVMMLAKRIDLYNPKIVRFARFAFVAYLILLELFVLYVRIQAKRNNDLTPIEISNPLSSVLKSQLGGSDGGGLGGNLLKSLATSLLSSSTTILEYDLKQANGMQSGLIFSILFVWFMHFKMNQVQPLLIQTANGIIQMVYSPLFQVYILGRNLKRPFPTPSPAKSQTETNQDADAVSDTTSFTAVEGEVNDEGSEQEENAVGEDESDQDENDEEDESNNDGGDDAEEEAKENE